MASKILDHCTACGACEPVCPTGAILPGPRFTVDSDACTDCGYCAPVCPVDAVKLEKKAP